MGTRYVAYWPDGSLQLESDTSLDPTTLAHYPGVATAALPFTAGQVFNGDAQAPAYITPPAAPVATTVSGTSFLRDRLTIPVVATAMQHADTAPDYQLKAFILLVQKTEPIDLADPATVQGVQYLASLGLITAAQATAILTP